MKDTGGYAFPTNELKTYECPKCKQGYIKTKDSGMTLRDYFAGQALIGVICIAKDEDIECDTSFAKYSASNAYGIADAMIAERSKQ